jgi:uncharacterized membrane protein YGL010W
MNFIALLAGVLTAFVIVKRVPLKKPNAYPLLLASFPVYYWAFAVMEQNLVAFSYEVLAGGVFIAIAIFSLKFSNKLSNKLALNTLALGFIGHGVYDAIPPIFYAPAVAPIWWPEFCGSVDVLIGVYLLYRANQ